ncbi:unnamed protein product [Sphenostylis stenocarpa]|uniref:Uncharacterized protein n=1 Tax=Sphenostylis stenocarpa TaxID=92480 RepID=A0AA86T0B8_9FABA|nr:unnamed protein product [Sphenostylis stenocarpa]
MARVINNHMRIMNQTDTSSMMELKEVEDEEWDTRKYSSKNGAGNGCMMRWVLNRGVCVGKKILVAGFVASAAPVVVPPLVVASAIGIAVSMPYVVLLASHVCTQNLMSKLLPRPTLQDLPLREEMCFQLGSDDMQIFKEEQALVHETKRDIGMDDFQYIKNGEIMALGRECAYGIKEHSPGEKNGVEVRPIREDNEEFKTSFGVTAVVLEESRDQAMEGGIEETELRRETRGLLEKIRDEGRTDMTQERGEYGGGICGGTNESGQKGGPIVEDMEEAWEDTSSTIGGTEEDLNVSEEMLHSRTDESKDTLLEGKGFDTTYDSNKPLTAPSEMLIPAESIEDLPIEVLVYDIPMDEDSSEVFTEKIDIHRGKLDYNISDFENPESQSHELNERMYSEDAEAREIANECAFDLFDGKRIDPDENAYTIDLHEESSNINGHTDSMEVLISSVEHESWPSECSSGENIIFPSEEVELDDENMWKQINVIRKIVGYEGTEEASFADELKALYIFTGVEPPTSLDENSIDPLEIKEKLQFLMSILGIKSNMS